jgi:hypothetical protein
MSSVVEPEQCPEPVEPVQCHLYDGHDGPHSPTHTPSVLVPVSDLQALLDAIGADVRKSWYWPKGRRRCPRRSGTP